MKGTVHTHRRSPLIYVIGVVLLGAGAYLAFELGRFQAGYSLLDQRREREDHAQLIAGHEASIEELKRQIALLETSREIDRETYAQVKANLSQLEAKIQAQEEELVFYRGIVSPQDRLAGLRIQELEVVPADAEQRYLMRLVLVQAIVHDQRVTGVVTLQIAGRRDGQAVEFALGELVADGESGELAYEFRYFQGLERQLLLPAGFEPESVELEIRPSRPRGEPVTQSFEWTAIISG